MNTYWKVSPGFNPLNNYLIVPPSWWWSQLAPWTSASTPAQPQTHSPASSLRRMWEEHWTFSCSSPTFWWQWSPLLTPPSSSLLSTGRCRARCWPGACVPAWPPTPPSRGQASSPTSPLSGPAWPGWCPPASTRRGWMQVGVFTWDHLDYILFPSGVMLLTGLHSLTLPPDEALNLQVPGLPAVSFLPDLSYLAPNCFHPSQKLHSKSK